MQQDKFQRAISATEHADESIDAGPSTSSPVCPSPADARKNSGAYWKAKYEAQVKINLNLSSHIRLDEIPGLLSVEKVRPKKTDAQSNPSTSIHGGERHLVFSGEYQGRKRRQGESTREPKSSTTTESGVIL